MGQAAVPWAAVLLSCVLAVQSQLLLPGATPEPAAAPPPDVPPPAPVVKPAGPVKQNNTAFNITPGGKQDIWLQIRPSIVDFRLYPWASAPEYFGIQFYSVKEYRQNNSDVSGHQIEDLVEVQRGVQPTYSPNTDGKGASVSFNLPNYISGDCPSAGVANGRRLLDNKGSLTFSVRVSTASQDKQNFMTIAIDADWPFCAPNNTLRIAAAVYAPRAAVPAVQVNKDDQAFDGSKNVPVKVIQFNTSNGLLGTFITPVSQRGSKYWALPGTNAVPGQSTELTFEFPNPGGDPIGYQMQVQIDGEYIAAPPPFPPPRPPPSPPPPAPPSPPPPPSPPKPKPSPRPQDPLLHLC